MIGNLNFDHSHSLTTLNGKNTYERVLPRKRGVLDRLTVSLPSESGFNTLSTSFSYSYLPGSLLLYNGSNEQLNLKATDWKTKYTRSFSFAKNYYFALDAGYNLQRRNEFVSYNGTTASVRYFEDKVFLQPSLSFNNHTIQASVGTDIAWLSRKFDTDKDTRWIFEPSMDFTWKPTGFWEWQSMYSHSFSPSGFYEVNPLRIYTSYNMASSGTGANNHSSGDNFSTSLRYNTPGYGWSGDLRYAYNTSHYNTLYESKLVNGVYTRQSVDEEAVLSVKT